MLSTVGHTGANSQHYVNISAVLGSTYVRTEEYLRAGEKCESILI
jgi:hypothetical protein